MRRGWKILLAVLAGLAVLLTLNTIALDNETRKAEVTVDGGEILRLPGGNLQVWDSGEPPDSAISDRPGGPGKPPPIVLIHCFSCSINWWDELIPLLEQGGHRVIAIDLLGHGGSEKPQSGYTMENQAQLVAGALSQLGVEGATVVGHSLGGTVAVALAEQSSELVDRLVIVDQAPDDSFGDLDLIAQLAFTPVIGEAVQRITPDFVIRDGLGQAFAPGFDVPDQFVEDFNRMTYTSFDHSAGEEEVYTDEEPLDQRIRSAFVPLLVIFGAEDQIYDSREALSAYADVPGAQTELVQGAGHSPNVESPARTAALILAFAKPPPQPPKPESKPKKGNGKAQKQASAKTQRQRSGGARKSGAAGKQRGGSAAQTKANSQRDGSQDRQKQSGD
ncbi:MAG: alpha/beta hydrolase [Actinomycetota bacterium]